ncbi:chloride channel CLIC-like protein 1 [Poeciliopsis prolifica]|uniref:chloride channel CLIC-like protein 1 n=1 Tax=Poeciliopsis prolifica TaxID=188132 RepID=UPI0024136ADD|nr:chloride channel CLIC-like protein 1 [Poeciliopsis prolifica]
MDDEWLDPYDMLNYDSVAKTMRKSIKTEPHWRSTGQHVEDLQRQIGMLVLSLLAIICIQKKSSGPLICWPLKFIRVLIFYFLVSIPWTWICLYQVAFFEHQNIIRETANLNEECKGIEEMHWTDGLKESFRTSRPLHDDPCEDYYAFFRTNPLHLVCPTKVVSFTFRILMKDPLRHFGEGISELHRAILKHLPVTLQFPVFMIIMLIIVWFMNESVEPGLQHDTKTPINKQQDLPSGVKDGDQMSASGQDCDQAVDKSLDDNVGSSTSAETSGFVQPDLRKNENEENVEAMENPSVSSRVTNQQKTPEKSAANTDEPDSSHPDNGNPSQADQEAIEDIMEDDVSSMSLKTNFKELPTSVEETSPKLVD